MCLLAEEKRMDVAASSEENAVQRACQLKDILLRQGKCEEDGDSPALADLAAQIATGEGAVVAVLPQLTGEERPQAAVS